MLPLPAVDGRTSSAFWTPNENGYKLPAEIEDILIQAEQGDNGWWSVARTLADFIAELPEAHRKTMRARVIRQAAVLRKVQPSTMRDAIHVAETFPIRIELDPAYSLLGWQHAVRAARVVGDGDKALAILRQVVSESDDRAGQCPPVSRVNELVREANGRTPAPKRRRWSGTVVSRVVGSPYQIVVEIDSVEERPIPGDMLTLIEVPQGDE